VLLSSGEAPRWISRKLCQQSMGLGLLLWISPVTVWSIDNSALLSTYCKFLLSNSTMEPRSINKPLSNTRRRRPQTQNLPIQKPKRFTRTRERYCVCIEKEEILIACLLLSVKSSTTKSHSKTLARLKLGCSKPNEVVSGIYPKNAKNMYPVSARISSTQFVASIWQLLQLFRDLRRSSK